MSGRMTAAECMAAAAALLLAVRVLVINNNEDVINASTGRGQYRISEVSEYASIYDCNGVKLNNRSVGYKVLINPNDVNSLKAMEYVTDLDTFNNGMKGNLPFLCPVKKEAADIFPVFAKYTRTDDNQPAKHIIGYTSDNEGVCGIEYAYSEFIHSNYEENKAVFSVNAVGGVLDGLYSEISAAGELEAGVITTIDADIQQICENAMEASGYEKGAIIVMDVKNGYIKACASYPEYNISNLEESLDDSRSPFINRAFSAYSVGSIFKLVTASAALESGISPEFSYTCTGSIDVNGQIFNCHKWGGHGEIDMREAIESSCNPYFIALSEYIDSGKYLQTAKNYGFGQETVLCRGVVSESGYLPSEKELAVKAEKGNFSFGQGMLTATPLQICRMTAAIANDGMCAEPKLIIGTRDKYGTVLEEKYQINKRVISYLTAGELQKFMADVVNADNSRSKSYMVECAGKTSTAQTGRYDENGNEEMNCWFTGYFPVQDPKYAVTVLIENGVSGNVSCGPVFKAVAEGITVAEKNKAAEK